MSKSKSQPTETKEHAENTSDTDQASLFDTDTYQQSSSDALPEDITREFNIPTNNAIPLIDIPTAEIKEKIKPDWEKAKEITNGNTTTPEWVGKIEADFLDLIPRYLSPSIEEFRIGITELGWIISVVDRGNVAMFRLWMGKEDFKEYNVETEGVVGVDMEDLKESLQDINTDSIVKAKFTDERKMVIDDGTEISYPLINPDSIRRTPDLPDHKTEQKITLPTEEFYKIISRMDPMAEYIDFKSVANDNSIVIKTEADKIKMKKEYESSADLTTINHRRKAERMFSKQVTRSKESTFTNSWFGELFKGMRTHNKQDTISITFGEEMPINIEKNISANSNFKMMLAPRVN
jgi:proliferating cell nuclear antigen